MVTETITAVRDKRNNRNVRRAAGRRPLDGTGDWRHVDFDKCFPYFAETYGCGICIAVCPWSATGRALVLAERWTRRREKGKGRARS
ncbi:MAG: hypothetical protein F4X99_13060 [Gammaproteobacteria bacterium]|nr:hypothetical protein [Gammaproteobacteria bacterium]MYE83218.1 hypothetical protein [Gammaproteobacteria bacterium]